MSPGDLVVCVNVGIIPESRNWGRKLLTLGDVYVLKDISSCPRDGHLRVQIWEVSPPPPGWWNAKRFRPCRKTNIDGFTVILEEREHAHSCP